MTSARVAQSALEATVYSLRPGDKVRVTFAHRDQPVVGVLVPPRNRIVAEGMPQVLLIDSPCLHMVRTGIGRPGPQVVEVDVLTSSTGLTEDERYDILAVLLQQYAELVQLRRAIDDSGCVAATLTALDVADKKAEINVFIGGVL